jgi:TetR/AcrR family transcriptional regulator, fatty acid metabolism regulator protein
MTVSWKGGTSVARSVSTKRELQREETWQKIHDTAMDLFTRKGFTRVSVEEICDKVGVSKGTFYYYFKSKDQVLLEEYLKVDDFYQEWMERLSKKHKSPTGMLEEFTGMSFEYMNGLGVKILKVIYHSEIDPVGKKSELASASRPLYVIIEQLVREGQERGELRGDVNALVISALWVRCYRGIIYEWCLQNGKFDLTEAGRDFFKMLIEYLRAGKIKKVSRI